MVKTINKDAFAIKALLKKGFSPIKVARILGLSRQKVNYWRKTEIKSIQYRRKKLDDSYINKIYELAKDKTTSQISSRKIANLINKEFSEANILTKDEKPTKICHSTICHYLNQKMGRPRKIRKAFYLTKKQMKKRVDFCKKIIEKKNKG